MSETSMIPEPEPGPTPEATPSTGTTTIPAPPRSRRPPARRVSGRVLACVVIAIVAVAGGATAYYVYDLLTNTGIHCNTGNATLNTAVVPVPASAPAPQVVPLPVPSHAIITPAVLHGRDNPAFPMDVVAAENFWGSLLSQLGGNLTIVHSLITDPNADPHEYEANSTDATLISSADYVVVNGVGYDDWAIQMIQASEGQNPNREVLNVGDLNGVPDGGNPHLWYNPTFVNATLAAMYSNLVSVDLALNGNTPAHAQDVAYFQQNYADLNTSLQVIFNQEALIRGAFAGTLVMATESIFVYLANATHLHLVSPYEFMDAVAAGNDPSEQAVAEFESWLESGQVRVLVYNAQTVTPITQQMKSIAAQCGVPTTYVTETVQPLNLSFEQWFLGELEGLQNALNANELGQ